MKLHALVQLERVCQPVIGHVPALGEIADDLATLAAVVFHQVGEHRADGVQQRERLRGMAVVVRRLGGHREIQDAATLGRLRQRGCRANRCNKKCECGSRAKSHHILPLALAVLLIFFLRQPAMLDISAGCAPGRSLSAGISPRVPAEPQSSREDFQAAANAHRRHRAGMRKCSNVTAAQPPQVQTTSWQRERPASVQRAVTSRQVRHV